MRNLNNSELNIFNCTYELYYIFNKKDVKASRNSNNIHISSYNGSFWKSVYGDQFGGFAIYNNVYLDHDENNILTKDVGLLAHEFVHVIQFREKPVSNLFKIVYERFRYGKDVYKQQGTLEHEAHTIQNYIVLTYDDIIRDE